MAMPVFTPPDDVVDALADGCETAAVVALGLDEEAFGRANRRPPWDVKALLGHRWRDVDRILVHGSEPPPDEADSDAIRYHVSGYDPIGDAPDVSKRASGVAAMFAIGADLSRSFDERGRSAVAFARSLPPERLVRTFGPCLRLDEYPRTRTLEAAVGTEPPRSLGGDDVAFIEVGTGRRAVTDAERAALGRLADAMPLLS